MNLFEKHKKCTGNPIGLYMFADDIAELVIPNKYKISINDDIYKFADYLVYEINRDATKIFDNMGKYKFCETLDFSNVWKFSNNPLLERGFLNSMGAERDLRYTIIYCIAYSIKNSSNDYDMFIHEIVRMSFVLYEKLHNRYSKLVKEMK